MSTPLPRSTPEAQGIGSQAMLGFLDGVAQQGLELHSLMLLRHGHVVAEGWWQPFERERLHLLYSLSKSFASTAVGLAVAEGRLTVDDPVISFFPDETPAEPSENLAAMQVRHLLCMGTGHDQDVTPALHASTDGDWVRDFLAQPVQHAPGSHFAYNSAATFMLSAIVQKLTGETLLDYLRPRLLDPLGIEHATWENSPRGINIGGWGMSITTDSIARFGQLYLQRGMWQGQQLVPAEWIDEASTSHISNGSDPNNDWNQGYGYQFWRCRHNVHRGDGAFGQFCVVMPDQQAVLAITSGVRDMQAVLNLVWQFLLPAMGTAPQGETPATAALVERLAGLAYPPPVGEATTPLAAEISGTSFRLEPNELGLASAQLEIGSESDTLVLGDSRGEHRITAGHGVWLPGTSSLHLGGYDQIVAAGAWVAENSYVVTCRFYETPYAATLVLTFEGDRLLIDAEMNVSFGPTSFPQIVGQREA